MTIGATARATGVSAKMIRYYEEIGLIPAPARSSAGYRVYSEKDVHVLRFVRRARDLGFSLAEIAELLGLWRDQSRHSAEVRRIASRHLETLTDRIRDLQEMADTLGTLIECCHGDDRPDCPILARLEGADGGAESASAP